VVAKDLGTKLTCQSCEAKFYDFNKKKPICPACETEFIPLKTRTRRTMSKVEKAPEIVKKDEIANVDKIETENIVGATSEMAADSNNIELSEGSLEDIDIPEVEDVEEDNSTLIEDTSDMADDNNDIAGVIVNNDDPSEVI